VNYTKRLLAEVGLEPERLEMYFLSSAEGVRFAEIATEMTERARQLGPNPLKNGERAEQPAYGEA
jgi:coenzyme F420-reducing hydrogenase delta subunit